MGVGGAMSKELIAIAMAAAGYTFTTWHERTVQQRAGRLERVNQQGKDVNSTTGAPQHAACITASLSRRLVVRLLYGPLLACVNSSKAAFEAMVRQHSHASSSDTFSHVVRSNPRGPEAEAYRQVMLSNVVSEARLPVRPRPPTECYKPSRRKWMVEVLQPLNERAAELIFKHSDLLDSSTINPILLQFISHVAANRCDGWGARRAIACNSVNCVSSKPARRAAFAG